MTGSTCETAKTALPLSSAPRNLPRCKHAAHPSPQMNAIPVNIPMRPPPAVVAHPNGSEMPRLTVKTSVHTAVHTGQEYSLVG